MRHPLQGVTNILRFNWHFYLLAIAGTVTGLLIARLLGGHWFLAGQLIALLVVVTTLLSLLVSWYVYDYSDLYTFNWIRAQQPPDTVVNIHAGFDETSDILARRYPQATLHIFDFYDPTLHTEVSIKRARRAYPAHPATISITTQQLPLDNGTADLIFLTLAAHEIRDDAERVTFFKTLRNRLGVRGQIVVTEHLRDTANFLAYTFGCFHFLSRGTWLSTFQAAGLLVSSERNITPFLTTFTLVPDGDAP